MITSKLELIISAARCPKMRSAHLFQ